MVKIEIRGIDETIKFLSNKNKEINTKADVGVRNAAFMLEGEVIQSISGRRSEPRSVDTGAFMGSIKTVKEGDAQYSVQDGVSYGAHLEYGTSRIQARRHFGNSANRKREDMRKEIEKAIGK